MLSGLRNDDWSRGKHVTGATGWGGNLGCLAGGPPWCGWVVALFGFRRDDGLAPVVCPCDEWRVCAGWGWWGGGARGDVLSRAKQGGREVALESRVARTAFQILEPFALGAQSTEGGWFELCLPDPMRWSFDALGAIVVGGAKWLEAEHRTEPKLGTVCGGTGRAREGGKDGASGSVQGWGVPAEGRAGPRGLRDVEGGAG